MNRCVISSSAAVVSRNVRRGLPVASGEVERITRQHMRSPGWQDRTLKFKLMGWEAP